MPLTRTDRRISACRVRSRAAQNGAEARDPSAPEPAFRASSATSAYVPICVRIAPAVSDVRCVRSVRIESRRSPDWPLSGHRGGEAWRYWGRSRSRIGCSAPTLVGEVALRTNSKPGGHRATYWSPDGRVADVRHVSNLDAKEMEIRLPWTPPEDGDRVAVPGSGTEIVDGHGAAPAPSSHPRCRRAW